MESEIKPDIKPFKKLIEEIRFGYIKIPTFQRNFVWAPRDIKLLLDSLYKKYPIGSFIFWETNKPLDHHREICGRPLLEVEEGTKINYVLDGQQRSTSLYAAVEYGKIDEEIYIYFFDISKKCFDYKRIYYAPDPLKIDKENQEFEKDLIKKEQAILEKQNCVPLNKIFVDAPTYYKYVEKFPENLRQEVHELYSKFNEYPFSIITLKNEGDLRKICKIFDRINNTGKKLSIVATMVAHAWSEDFNLRLRLNQLRKKLEDDGFGEVREVTILQIAAVIFNDKKCKNKEIRDNLKIEDLKENWNKIEEALYLSIDYLKQKFNVSRIDYLPFDSILVVLSYIHHNEKNLTKYDQKIREWFWKASLSNRYSSSVETKIEDDCKTFDKILAGETAAFVYPIDWTIMKNKIIEQRYHLRNAFCKTIISLFASNFPRDFDDKGTILNLAKTFSSLNRRNMHHVFPKEYLLRLKKKYEGLQDSQNVKKIGEWIKNIESIANIMLIPFKLNRRISYDEPNKYFKELQGIENLDAVLKSHFIGDLRDFGIEDDDFETFLDKRAEAIKSKFEELVGVKT